MTKNKIQLKSSANKNKDSAKLAYRLLTGADDRAFCEKVSDALKNGYELYGSPAITFNGEKCIAAQAVVLKKK